MAIAKIFQSGTVKYFDYPKNFVLPATVWKFSAVAMKLC
jgi:hypothetical protein